ncbi:major facilitator transporter (plasmid) [Sphingopyxis sp. FD7]|nr:major facilitator transporter [Sphingopyxis sp. FD7]
MTPERSLGDTPMGARRWVAIALAVFLNGLDGYDAASISFAAPGIAADWGLGPAVLGWVLSMELIGMAAGSLAFGMAADKYGRRPCILACLVLMAGGMFGATYAENVEQLSAYRIVTGLGIGGMLASLTAVVAEYSNDRWRPVVISTMIVGYPIGTVLGGLVARQLVAAGDWRDVFLFGFAVTVAALPLAFALLPESPVWLARSRNHLTQANAVLQRFRLPPASAREPTNDFGRSGSLLELFRHGLARTTVLLTLAYVGHMSCYYFIFKWLPKLVVDLGHPAQAGADMLIVAMLAGAAAGPVFGLLAGRITLPRASILVLLGAALAVNLFARVGADLMLLTIAAALVGIFFNSGGVAFYALLANAFPAELRGRGIGFGVGVGRAGAALGPAMAGAMLAADFGLPSTALVMGMGPLLGAVIILVLFRPTRDR